MLSSVSDFRRSDSAITVESRAGTLDAYAITTVPVAWDDAIRSNDIDKRANRFRLRVHGIRLAMKPTRQSRRERKKGREPAGRLGNLL